MLVVFLTLSSPARAASENDQCAQIPVGAERALCYDRQNPSSWTNYSEKQMKLEDEKLAKRLQGICRGC